MMKSVILHPCFALLLFTTSAANAIDVGIGARKSGLNGLGIDLTVGLSENLNLSPRRHPNSMSMVRMNRLPRSVTDGSRGRSGCRTSISTMALRLFFSIGICSAVDFASLPGCSKTTVPRKVLRACRTISITGGDPLATDDFIGDIAAEIYSLGDSYQPYIGIGWGRGAGGDGGFSFSADLGVALTDIEVDPTMPR